MKNFVSVFNKDMGLYFARESFDLPSLVRVTSRAPRDTLEIFPVHAY